LEKAGHGTGSGDGLPYRRGYPDNRSRDALTNDLESMVAGIKDYVTMVVAGQWDQAVDAFDAARDQIFDLAHTFAAGIIQQFPDRF
jgi:hypothetical protein